jgi:hypothetical protein
MAGLVPAIHVLDTGKTWMPGTPSEAALRALAGHDADRTVAELFRTRGEFA